MLVSLSTLLRGTTYEKLKWTFTLYDLNKDGYITKQEVLNVMVAVHELMGLHASPLVSLYEDCRVTRFSAKTVAWKLVSGQLDLGTAALCDKIKSP